MNLPRTCGAAVLALALCAPPAYAAEAPAPEQLFTGAMPQLRLSPLTLEVSHHGRRRKRRKKKHAAPPPAPAETPTPDLGSAPTPDTAPAPDAAGSATPGTSDVPPAEPAPSTPVTPGGSSSSSSSGGDMNFDLLGDTGKHVPTADELQVAHEAEVRRTMFTFHEGIGLSTLTLLAATCVVGQLNYMDKFGGNAPANTARWEQAHSVLAFTTLTGFAATGIIGLTAPVPYKKKVEVDTTLFHKLFMGGAALGMASELGLGVYTASHEGLAGQKSVAQLHQVIGFTTLALMGAGASAFIF